MIKSRRLKAFTRALVGSIALHGIVLLGFIVTKDSKASQVRYKNVIVTKLVKLGKKRKKELLPRKSVPQVQVTEKKMLLNKSPNVIKQKPKVIVEKKERLLSALERLKKTSAAQDDSQGDPEGVAEGTETDLDKAIVGNRFATEIYRCLKSKYELAGLEPAQVVGKSVSVILWIAADGSFKDHRIEQGSGIERFDHAVEQAILRCAKVGPPPKSIQKAVFEDGIEVQFQP